ncbi:hypothetical protein HPB50_008781 [Hyalomma asiaticum]|uniref:Uncharacterized protein n=1 Tax=Hyalomma asiaticum TaxID=266040 RepID=A0ACB7S8T3_HYAAI|nr:hypothetical protein HPB50_008781 [Hyalomma asiaticum]
MGFAVFLPTRHHHSTATDPGTSRIASLSSACYGLLGGNRPCRRRSIFTSASAMFFHTVAPVPAENTNFTER